ncbi:MAG: HAD hydrolase-like protein [Sulfolobales archaeon]
MGKVLLVDLDLTLIDSLRGMYVAFISTLSDRRSEIPDLSSRSFVIEYYENDLSRYINDKEFPERWRFWNEMWRRYVMNAGFYGTPFKCVHDTLRALKGRYYIVITTGREIASRDIKEELRRSGIRDLVHEVYSVGDLGIYKRKTDLYMHLMSRFKSLGFNPENMVVISDSYRDLLNAEKFGMSGVGFVPEGLEVVEEYFRRHGIRYFSSWCSYRELESYLEKI